MENLIYLGKVNLCWIVFYTCFWLFFRKYTFFRLNRFYLLGTLLLALFLPLITISETAAKRIPDVVYSISVKPELSNQREIVVQNVDFTVIILVLYFTGVIFLSFNLFKGFVNLLVIIRKGKRVSFENQTLILLPEKADQGRIGSFSFFKWLVISQKDYGDCLANIVRHEMVHIRQRHSADILIVEFLKIIFWFNPVLWLYKISMQEVHEFLADAEAPDLGEYADFLISYSFNTRVLPLSNSFFNSSLLKNRIKMIFQNRTPRRLLSKYIVVLPLLGLIVLLTAGRGRLSDISNFKTKNITNEGSKEDGKYFVKHKNGNRADHLKIEKRSKEKDTVAGKSVLDRNAYFGKGFRWTENYFYSQIKYPIEAVVAEIQGKVTVSFTVDEKGYVRDAEIVDGLGYGIDEEALGVVQNMPQWNYAIRNGKPSAVRITMGIDFYPALAAATRKSDIEIRKEYYNAAPKLAPQNNRFFTISEIGKRVNKLLDFSAQKAPETKVSKYGYMFLGSSFYPKIKVAEDSAVIEKR